MGFILTDLSDEERVLSVNFWNWRPTVELMGTTGLFDASRLEMLQEQCCASRVGLEEARSVAKYLREIVLPRLQPDSRVLLDQTVTTELDDGIFHREAADFHRNYSATHPWLEQFAEFCEVCGGFQVD